MERDKALKLWDAIYGQKSSKWQKDCFGTWIYRDDYANQNMFRIRPDGDGKKHNYGWEVDHIRPQSTFINSSDGNFLNNYEIIHIENNRMKSNSFPHFKINDKTYRIVKCKICSSNGFRGYGIIDDQDNRVDWKGEQNSFFKTNK